MKLVRILDQSRRDFQGEYRCEFCNHTERDSGMSSYDDRYYHDTVVPQKKCKSCGQSTLSGGGTPERVDTRYPEGYQI